MRKFGNGDSSPRFLRGGLTVKEQAGPLLDRIVGSEDITIVAELPEDNKEDLQLKADNKSLTLESVAGERQYQKKMVCQTKSSLILVGKPTRMECWKFHLKEKVQIDNGVTTSIN